MENNLPNNSVGLVLLDKTAQVVEECNLSDNPRYNKKIFDEKLSKLEKDINHLLPELKIKDLPLFNSIISSSFELGVVSATYNFKFSDSRNKEPSTKNILVERNKSTINENPITG